MYDGGDIFRQKINTNLVLINEVYIGTDCRKL